MSLGRRLLRGSGGYSPPAVTVTGPYAPTDPHTVRVLTQLHCHTTGSDGTYSPATIVGYYLGAGYGALAITDHDVVTTQPAGITTAIVGNEHSPSQQHIIAIDSDYTRGGTTAAQTIIDGIVADGGQAEIAHPDWIVGMTTGEMAALTDYLGIEIHNAQVVTGAGGNSPVTYPGYALATWDTMLATRRDVWGLAVDDLHILGTYTTYDVGRVWAFVASNSKANIMAALVAGNFVSDVSNYGVTPGFPYRSPAGISLVCPGAIRIEAWGAGGLLTASDADSHAHQFDGTEEYVRLVAVGDYTEPFDSLSDRWQAVEGTWAISAGTLTVSSDVTPRRIVLRRHREGDFTAQVDVKIGSGGTDTVAFLFNVLDSNYWFMLRIGESSVSGYNNQLAVAKTTDGNFAPDSQLDNYAFDPAPDTWYTMKMEYTGSTGRVQGKVWERGTSEPAYQVDATDTTWKHGAFGFRANRSGAFDNLYISGFRTYYQPVAVD